MTTMKTIDFSGTNIYIGIDTHKNNWTVTILVDELEHKTFSQNPDPSVLSHYLKRNFPNANYFAVYEAGYCGFWIQNELEKLGLNCCVVNPADVPTKDKERKRKNNRVDSRKLARSLRAGELDPIYIPDREAQEDRSLIRARKIAVKQQTRYKNQIKATLSFYGTIIPESLKKSRWSGAFIQWLEDTPMKTESGKESLMYYIDELKHYRKRVAEVNRKVRKLAYSDKYKEQIKNLISIPGVGIITAMILLTELIDIDRFESLDFLASYVGLVPGEDSSGDDDDINTTGITPRGNKYLKSILIEAAWIAARKDPALTICYKNLTKRMSGQKAIIRIAKKLLNRIRYVIKNNKPYVSLVVE